MAEQTRLWRGNDRCDLEFDYLAVLKSWPGCEDFLLEHNTDGQMEVKFKVVDNQYVNLNPEVKFVLASNLHTCINETCRQNWCALSLRNSRDNVDSFSGCQFCSVCMKTGKLTCIDTQLQQGNLYDLFHLNRLRFLWTSKKQSVYISDKNKAENIFFTNVKHLENDILMDRQNTTFLPELLEENNRQLDEVKIEIDFNPVLELDKDEVKRFVRTVVHVYGNSNGILFQSIYPHGNESFSTSEAHIHQPSSTANVFQFVYFILKILAVSKQFQLKRIPSLDTDQDYMLFPKGYIHSSRLWRISTCQCELKVLRNTSSEHRLAFCVLKFLVMKLKRFDMVFPSINQYEAKLAVINHIKVCKTTTVGAHVCFMRILHDIACCRGEQSMNHPFLHLDLYDILRLKASTIDRYNFISLKVLLLILVNQKGRYTAEDLLNDLLSIKFLVIWYNSKLSALYGSFRRNYFSRELKCALHKLVERRKMNTSSRFELTKVILSILRDRRIKKI